MNRTSSMLCPVIDDTFGPHAGDCRGGLDFTLLFEETILTILPLALILIVAPQRLFYLSKKQVKVDPSPLLHLKLVCDSLLVSSSFYVLLPTGQYH
jgi:hypothetical protein